MPNLLKILQKWRKHITIMLNIISVDGTIINQRKLYVASPYLIPLISSLALTRFKTCFYVMLQRVAQLFAIFDCVKMCLNIINQHGRTRLVHTDHVTLIPRYRAVIACFKHPNNN